MNHRVIISIGSCHLPTAHMPWAAERLSSLLGNIRFSRMLWTADIKDTGIWYMNRLCAAATTLSVDQLTQALKNMETETNRQAGRITIDLDLMSYDDERYHLNDWPRPYIQQLLNDIL
ncbi:MAG: 2-amino-4-hydroxy-6-hydroxymethyldihydropteridine diphosphokinase [Prevotella sp.]|nr:2-amino-4-hydroxy-6-hydroxymethyldihydropteridine diphosphokinase [Prevotella sp.]